MFWWVTIVKLSNSFKCRPIFNQRKSNLKIKIRGAVASREQPSPSLFRRRRIAVVDCRRCWLHLCKVTTVLYHIFPNGRAIIGFNHGLPWCVKYMALGPPVATKPSGFAVGFCGDQRPSCHVFHTSRQAMIKTYIIVPVTIMGIT